MMLFITLILILFLIVLSLFIQHLVKSKSILASSDENILNSFAMITSDWYIEPWYSSGGGSVNNWDINLMDDWYSKNPIICSGIGEYSGIPICLLRSALDNFSKGVAKEQRLLFFTGDILSHDNKPNLTKSVVMKKIFDGVLNYFFHNNIFYAVGDFWQDDTVRQAWAQSLVNNNIYIPRGPDDIFWDTGYYKKLIPNSTIYVICFNSILYSDLSTHSKCTDCTEKQQKQINQLKKDLDSLKPENTVYILYHSKLLEQQFIWNMIGTSYQNRISGIITSDKSNPLNSLDSWSISNEENAYTWNIPSIYWSYNNLFPGKLVSSYISVPFNINVPLVLAETDVHKTICQHKNLNFSWTN